LELFTDLGPEERLALYALRCCFAHVFRLLNIKTEAGLTHAFYLTEGPGRPVVRLPQRPWSGDVASLQGYLQTSVDLRAFGDLVEQVVVTLRELNERGELEAVEDLAKYALEVQPLMS